MTERPDLIQRYEHLFQSNGDLFGITLNSTKIVNVTETVPSLIGEHMCSICTYHTVEFANAGTMEFFVKRVPPDQTGIDLVNSSNSFKTEARFYNVLLKDLQKIWLQRSG